MARKHKANIKDGIDRRDVGYYSTPNFVAKYLAEEMLRLNPDGCLVLDPAIGKEELTEHFSKVGKTVVGYDIIRYKTSYQCSFDQRDFIETYIEGSVRDDYDYIIMNPPYNCHEHESIANHKAMLKRHFHIGVFNTYALFLSAVIDIAKDGSLIGAIVPDAILSAVSYQALRNKIFTECSILQLLLCPDDLFHSQLANSSTCILILKKGKCHQGEVLTANRSPNKEQFQTTLRLRQFKTVQFNDIVLKLGKSYKIFTVGVPSEIVSLFTRYPKLGDIYKCGGGVSTGNDSQFTSPIESPEFSIPFFSNPASQKFNAEPNSYLSDRFLKQSRGRRNFIIRNRRYLNHEGIVCSSVGKRFSTAYLPATGVHGVNATIWPPSENIDWLLAYLNSSLATYRMKAVIARGNMTTIGNVSSLPMPDFSAFEKNVLANMSCAIRDHRANTDKAINEIDKIVFENLHLSDEIRQNITDFCLDIAHSV